jgi:hypothetical protein
MIAPADYVPALEVLIRMARVKARELAADVNSAPGDTVLMDKYGLSAKQLEGALRNWLEVDLISYMQMYERTSLTDSQITKAFVDSTRAQEELN